MSQQGLFDELNSEMEEDDFSVSDTEYPSAFLEHPETYPILESIHIEALKAIDEIEVKLNPLTILTGPNNSGKSTILQAILLGYEGFRKCLNTNDWTLSTTGKAESEFEFIPVNQPKDLWNEKVWKPSREEEQYIRVKFQYTNGFYFTTAIRFLYGMLNIGLEEYSDDYSDELLKALASTAPILLPASNDPKSHESVMAEAQLHHLIDKENPSNLIRNILFRVQNDDESENNGEKNETSWGFIKKTIRNPDIRVEKRETLFCRYFLLFSN